LPFIEVIIRSCYRNIEIVDLDNQGEDKSPLTPVKKGGFKKPIHPSPPFLKGDLGGFDRHNSLE
jgi:hypothetical protein